MRLFLLFFLRLVTVRNSSVRRSKAVALRSGSGSKQRRMKALASRDMDSGISGWILNIPTCRRSTNSKRSIREKHFFDSTSLSRDFPAQFGVVGRWPEILLSNPEECCCFWPETFHRHDCGSYQGVFVC